MILSDVRKACYKGKLVPGGCQKVSDLVYRGRVTTTALPFFWLMSVISINLVPLLSNGPLLSQFQHEEGAKTGRADPY